MSGMPEPISDVRRRDRLIWTHPTGGNPTAVYIEVTRVARDGSWADIRCCTWAASWTKRQPLPLPAGTLRRAWTHRDLERDADAVLNDLNAYVGGAS